MNKRTLVMVSSVKPIPGTAGQQVRVRDMLRAVRDYFEVTFVTFSRRGEASSVRQALEAFVHTPVVLPSRLDRPWPLRLALKGIAQAYAGLTGLKRSNFTIGRLELTPARVRCACGDKRFDVALFEYWHASRAVAAIRHDGCYCALDMHDLLWQSYDSQLRRRGVPERVRVWRVQRYRAREEKAWELFDGLIPISEGEGEYVRGRVVHPEVFVTPMGIDTKRVVHAWEPMPTPRLAFFGGFASAINRACALRCARYIMPRVWDRMPAAELWIVGADPPREVRELETDRRIRVTGFVSELAPVLTEARVLLCPWNGTYGFRTRIVEAMALGLPVVASPDAVHGMGLQDGRCIMVGRTDGELADQAIKLLADAQLAVSMSRNARAHVERCWSFEATYGALARFLVDRAGRGGRRAGADARTAGVSGCD
ncbi:MAG: glycosyltransferase family 4 protein [Acidobacteriota bacterium]